MDISGSDFIRAVSHDLVYCELLSSLLHSILDNYSSSNTDEAIVETQKPRTPCAARDGFTQALYGAFGLWGYHYPCSVPAVRYGGAVGVLWGVAAWGIGRGIATVAECRFRSDILLMHNMALTAKTNLKASIMCIKIPIYVIYAPISSLWIR